MMADTALINSFGVEDAQNFCNKMAAARSKFFARKIHKLKKMLQPLFTRKPRPTPPRADLSDEEMDNSLNEEIEARLAQGLSGDDIHALENGRMTLIVVNPAAAVSVPQFFASTPGRFSWTFLPSPDYDICPVGDLNAFSSCQTPEQQTPPSSPL